jgi:cytochrome c oxidase assembly protein subunit 15
VRLSNAGLGCPDWPGCYGHLTPAAAAADQHTIAAPLAGRALNVGKAWREMVHRYAAGALALLIVLVAALSIMWRRERIVTPGYTLALVAIVVFQAILGALTVTRQLKPLIVTSHLLFGFTTLSLLWWLVMTQWMRKEPPPPDRGAGAARQPVPAARVFALLGLCVVVLQIALGGWTSSNYAAIACPDLPTCQGQWWPQADFRSAYVLWRDLDVDYEGGVLANAARIAIHLTHRLGAVVTTAALLLAAAAAFTVRTSVRTQARPAAVVLILALGLQLCIGIAMVLQGFPLWLATAHNAGAALLLLATLALIRSLTPVKASLRSSS